MNRTIVLDHDRIQRIIERFAHQLVEDFHQEKSIILIGISGRGVALCDQIVTQLLRINKLHVTSAELTIDKDSPYQTLPKLSIEEKQMQGKTIVLVDDVLKSGRTLTHALCHIMKTEVKQVSTIILVNRIHHKFPVRAEYVGISLSTNLKEHVSVSFQENNNTAYLS